MPPAAQACFVEGWGWVAPRPKRMSPRPPVMATEVVLPRLCTRWAPKARPTASRGSEPAAAKRCKAVSSLLALLLPCMPCLTMLYVSCPTPCASPHTSWLCPLMQWEGIPMGAVATCLEHVALYDMLHIPGTVADCFMQESAAETVHCTTYMTLPNNTHA